MILCEDKYQYYFVQSYLKCRGAHSRKIRCGGDLPPPGHARRFVETHYGAALNSIRKNENEILVVVCDADNDKTADVLKKFDNPDSFAAIPKRHIETWYYFLDNSGLAESSGEEFWRKNDYPKAGTHPTFYGKKLVPLVNDIKQGKIPSNIPESLKTMIARLAAFEEKTHRKI